MDIFPDRRTIISIGDLKVYWYGFLYVAGYIVALVLLPRLQKLRAVALSSSEWMESVTVLAIGAVAGGRLGYVLFYDPFYFIQRPLEIPAIWQGGMASHGGFIGVALAVWYLSRKYKVSFLALTDLLSVPAGLGLAFGRVGNFINQELYGTVTTLPWGVSVPCTSDLRHPVQIYAALKDLLVAGCSYLALRRTSKPGYATAIFLLSYGLLRFFVEFFREPLHPVWKTSTIVITEEQILTVIVFLVGVGLWHWLSRQEGKGS